MGMVRTNIGIEMISTILYFSNHYAILEKIMGSRCKLSITEDYHEELTHWIQPYLNHEVFSYVDELTEKGFFLGRPMELMCATDFETMTLTETLSPLCVEYSGGLECIQRLLKLLKDFANISSYKRFFAKIQKYYEYPIEYFYQHYPAEKIIDVVNDFFGKNENTYRIIWTELQRGSYGIHFTGNTKLKIYSVYTISGSTEFNEKSLEMACGAFSLNVIIHEFSHPYVNPLTEKYRVEVNQYGSAYEKLKPFKLPNYLSGYGDWEECVNEHIVRAISIFLSKKIRTSGLDKWHYDNSYESGYRYLPMLLEKLEYYDTHRDQYIDFESFYVELIGEFSKEV